MEYKLSTTEIDNNSECLVLGFCDQDYPSLSSEEFSSFIPKLAEKLRKAGDYAWQTDINGKSLMLINCGKAGEFSRSLLNSRLSEIITIVLKQNIKSISLAMPSLIDFDADIALKTIIQKIEEQTYLLEDFKTKDKKLHSLKTINIFLKGADKNTLAQAKALAEGMARCKTMANYPANFCTPSFIAEKAQELAKEHSEITVKVYNENEIKELKMGALLAVSQGSVEPPRFIEIVYKAAKDDAPIVLVGKGVTFDSGGLSIKPAQAMEEMKYDMAGAASVIGAIKAAALEKLPLNIVGLIPTTENLPSGTAIKPGDIITTMSGQTVEILNTDAEGRLILADALCYAERFKPKFVLDIATLTGAVIIALGNINTGLMTEDDELASEILKASKDSGDSCWRLPLEKAYQEALDSPLADMINANFDRSAGSVTAACFLSRFTKKYRWAHLDVAGTAWISGKKRQATGRPIPLLLQILRHATNSR